MIAVQQALEIIQAHTREARCCELPLAQAWGCILARDVHSDILMPPFDRATMDGYAFRSVDVSHPNAPLTVVGESAAGRGFGGTVQAGQAVRIMTGAPVPAGADCVQMLEKTAVRDGQVIIRESVQKGRNIAPAGSEVDGEDTLEAGRHIGTAEVAVLAMFGAAKVPVFRPPSVAILVTGDELVEATVHPGPDQIRNSNAYSLSAQVRSCRIEPTYLGIARDEEVTLQARIEKTLQCDIALVTGGVSMGKYDLVGKVLQQVGARIHFNRVAIKPGKPLTFATREGKLFFGLPGNPVSSFVTFEIFVRSTIARLMGGRRGLAEVGAKMKHAFTNSGPRDYYAPARTRWNGGWETEILKTRGSADIFRFSAADSLAVLPADSESQPGTERKVLLLSDYLERIGSP